MLIDLRSDTITKPTPAMLEAMFTAEVGDDVLGDDPTVLALEAKAAAMFGHGSGLVLYIRNDDEPARYPHACPAGR